MKTSIIVITRLTQRILSMLASVCSTQWCGANNQNAFTLHDEAKAREKLANKRTNTRDLQNKREYFLFFFIFRRVGCYWWGFPIKLSNEHFQIKKFKYIVGKIDTVSYYNDNEISKSHTDTLACVFLCDSIHRASPYTFTMTMRFKNANFRPYPENIQTHQKQKRIHCRRFILEMHAHELIVSASAPLA